MGRGIDIVPQQRFLCFLKGLEEGEKDIVKSVSPLQMIFAKRWWIGLILLVLLVSFEIHGSSIGRYSEFLQSPHIELAGKSRPIRYDEYVVNTPLAFSQYVNHFQTHSDIVRGTSTDMTLVYGQPTWDLITLFRPFQLGYLFLSPAKGLSFFWMARWISLFLVSLEFGLLLCRRKKLLATCYAFSLAFAPIVQWWFAINALVEMLIFGQAGVLLLSVYLKTEDYRRRLFYGGIISYLMAAFILTLYPAWQVPLAYIFLGLLCWIVYENRQQVRLTKKDACILSIAVLLAVGTAAAFLYRSYDVVQTIKQTVYPGGRFVFGGGISLKTFFIHAWNYLWSPILPRMDMTVMTNNCEAARFFDLAPLGLVISFLVWRKEKRVDFLCKILLGLLALFTAYELFVWPVILAKITLLDYSTPNRVLLGIGLLNLMLLFRTVAVSDVKMATRNAILLSVGVALLLTGCAYNFYPFDHKWKHFVAMFGLSSLLWYIILRGKKRLSAGLLIAVLLLSGATINPVSRGVDSIYKSALVQAIQSEVRKDPDALWVVNTRALIGNVPIMAGARTINSINCYPVLDRWRMLDEDGRYASIYNRYAHIRCNVDLSGTADEKEKFVLDNGDAFTVTLDQDDLRKLDVRYILSIGPIPELDGGIMPNENVFQRDGFWIYRLAE